MKTALSAAKYNGFVGMVLDCNDISNFPEIIETTKNMFGWVTHHIDLEKKVNEECEEVENNDEYEIINHNR